MPEAKSGETGDDGLDDARGNAAVVEPADSVNGEMDAQGDTGVGEARSPSPVEPGSRNEKKL